LRVVPYNARVDSLGSSISLCMVVATRVIYSRGNTRFLKAQHYFFEILYGGFKRDECATSF